MTNKNSEIYDILKKLTIKIKTENVDSMCSNKTYERTTVELYFKGEDGNEHFISDDFVDKEINEDTLNTKDEKYIESLEKQLNKAKELLKKYNNKASCCGEFMKYWTVQKLWEETNKFLNYEIFESIEE